jgi:predicted nucleic acid-binding protein
VRAVFDSSALIDALTYSNPATRDLLARTEAHAPELLGIELLSYIRRLTLRTELEPSGARQLIHLYSRMAITRHSPELLLARVWDMRHTISAYDATYVSLAELIDCPLITRDRRLASAAEPYCEVIVPA